MQARSAYERVGYWWKLLFQFVENDFLRKYMFSRHLHVLSQNVFAAERDMIDFKPVWLAREYLTHRSRRLMPVASTSLRTTYSAVHTGKKKSKKKTARRKLGTCDRKSRSGYCIVGI